MNYCFFCVVQHFGKLLFLKMCPINNLVGFYVFIVCHHFSVWTLSVSPPISSLEPSSNRVSLWTSEWCLDTAKGFFFFLNTHSIYVLTQNHLLCIFEQFWRDTCVRCEEVVGVCLHMSNTHTSVLGHLSLEKDSLLPYLLQNRSDHHRP